MAKLNNLTVQRANKPGRLADGNGLYLQISKGLTKSWLFRYTLNKRSHEMGLGPYPLVSLAEARMKALDCRKQAAGGVDPLETKRKALEANALEAAKTISFSTCAQTYIEAHRSSWRSQKHAQQWQNTIESYANPIIGTLSIQFVTTEHVLNILQPIWYTKTETASRLRGRLESILAWATVMKFRDGENPARWRNHLDKLLPKRSSVQKVEHFAALPVSDVPNFVRILRTTSGVVAKALEFQILTATRPSETVEAKWSEVNFDEALLIIPGERMKAGKEHRVPLSPRAIEILRECQQLDSEFIFPGRNPKKSLSNNALLMMIKTKFNLDVTSHGFRSSFNDWASENTQHSRDVIEMSLAHTIKNKVEAAYRRGDLILKRRLLMNEWATFCSNPLEKSARVTSIKSRFQ